MASITAIELGADTCAFARIQTRRGEVRLLAADVLDPAAFPGQEAFTAAVRRTRRALHLPRHCRVVLWGLPDGANRKDAAIEPLLAPLTGAGFKVDRVVSPCNALAALARLKTSRAEGSTCWVAINRGGVAIVVLRPGKLLYAHSFAWDSSIGASGSQARLLQRYSLVAFLSPEVTRAMAEARKSGTPVDAVVTCGNLPDLRSLTMPLIEELDVEVETLDSFEGLVVEPSVLERLVESASAIRLACAAVIARGTRPWDPSQKRAGSQEVARYARAALLAAAVIGIGYWYVKLRPVTAALPIASAPAVSITPSVAKSNPPAQPQPVPGSPIPESRSPIPAPRSPIPDSRSPIAAAKTPIVSAPPPPTPAKPLTAPGSPIPEALSPIPDPRVPVVAAKTPIVSAPPPAPAKPLTAPGSPIPESRRPIADPRPAVLASRNPLGPPPVEPSTVATAAVPRVSIQPLLTVPRPNVPPGVSAPPVERPRNDPRLAVLDPRSQAPAPAPRSALLNTPANPADKPKAASQPRGPLPALLTDAIPKVTAILVSPDRQFATVDGGQIVGVGDLVGRRTVVGMDDRSVLLQEPSGVQIRIGLGGRLLGVERPR